jgi:hypothetical protein
MYPSIYSARYLRWYRAALIPMMILLFLLSLLFAGCATLDDAAVARTDRLPEAPFYKSYRKGTGEPEPAVLLPLKADPKSAARLDKLRVAIDDYLANMSCCRISQHELPVAGAPWLYVGSSEGEDVPMEAAHFREDFEKYPPMIVHFVKPKPEWKNEMRVLASSEGARRVVVTQLDFVQYPKADKGFFGKKVVLGSQHEEKVRFLSAIDKPIEVLQLSGAVLDENGVELCAGAEGIIGSDSPFWVQVLEAGKDIDDDLLEQVLHHERRDDIPGAPLNWQAAADQLMWNLLRRCS